MSLVIRAWDTVSRLIGKVYLDRIDMTPYGVSAASPDQGWLEVTRSPQGEPLTFTFGPSSARLLGDVSFELSPRIGAEVGVLALEARYPGISAFMKLPNMDEVHPRLPSPEQTA